MTLYNSKIFLGGVNPGSIPTPLLEHSATIVLAVNDESSHSPVFIVLLESWFQQQANHLAGELPILKVDSWQVYQLTL